MAQTKIYKFRDMEDVTFFLNGGLLSAKNIQGSQVNTRSGLIPGISGLVGKKLNFLQPAVLEVTFTAGGNPDDPQTLTFQEVKQQIETAFASALLVRALNGSIALIENAPNLGVHLTTASTGLAHDARALLGFTPAADAVSVVYKPAAISTTPPCWVWADTTSDGFNTIYTWE